MPQNTAQPVAWAAPPDAVVQTACPRISVIPTVPAAYSVSDLAWSQRAWGWRNAHGPPRYAQPPEDSNPPHNLRPPAAGTSSVAARIAAKEGPEQLPSEEILAASHTVAGELPQELSLGLDRSHELPRVLPLPRRTGAKPVRL